MTHKVSRSVATCFCCCVYCFSTIAKFCLVFCYGRTDTTLVNNVNLNNRGLVGKNKRKGQKMGLTEQHLYPSFPQQHLIKTVVKVKGIHFFGTNVLGGFRITTARVAK